MIKLTCGHETELKNIYDHQFFDGFSTKDTLCCPECKSVMCVDDFHKITRSLCKHKYLQKHTIYDTYLYPDNIIRAIVEPGKLYQSLHNFYMFWFEKYPEWDGDQDVFNESVPSIIYFEKYNSERFNKISELFDGDFSNDRISYRFIFK